MSLTNYDFAFGGGQSQVGGRRYKSGPGGTKAVPKKPRLKLRVVDGKLKYVPKKLRKRSGRNIFISEFAKKKGISGPALMKQGNAAWKKLSKAEKDKYERKADSMGFKPAAKGRLVAKRYSSKRQSPARSGRRKSPKRRSSPKRKSPKRRSSPKRKSPKRRSSGRRKSPKRRSSPKRKSPKRRSSGRRRMKGGSCGEGHSVGDAYEYDETYEPAPDVVDEFMF